MDQDSGRGGDSGKITEVRRVYKWVPETLESLDEQVETDSMSVYTQNCTVPVQTYVVEVLQHRV